MNGGEVAGGGVPGWVRVTLVTAGLVVLAFGAWTALTWVPARWWAPWALWLAGGVAVHDGVLAPLIVVLGWVVLGRVRSPRLREVLRGIVLVLGTLALVALVAVWAGAR
ncbi:hypothetical protein [Antribacter gilvus]|uniref:hypothetical protein n=1 Tax=Antribacter gilvus TaxID=2304675 RepID=UPI000F76B42E|nr:hypothetical protein [Antribacter gilvus]